LEEEVAHERRQSYAERLARLERGGPAAALRRVDALGEHPVADRPLAADAEANDRATQDEGARVRGQAADERAEGVDEDRPGEHGPLAHAVRERARDQAPEAGGAERHPEEPRVLVRRQVERLG